MCSSFESPGRAPENESSSQMRWLLARIEALEYETIAYQDPRKLKTEIISHN
jgi:hypothetical protein